MDELLWKCDPATAKLFVAYLEQAQFGELPVEETIELVRRLPQFPLEWMPGRPVRMVISRPVSRPLVQVPR